MSLPVGILITTYNDHEFLPKAIASCVMQDVEEIVLVDDGSDKQLPENIFNLLKGNKIKYIRHRENLGLAAARNTGFSNLKQDYIISLDADDIFYNNAVKILYENIQEADIICGNIVENSNTCKPNMVNKVGRDGICKLTKEDWLIDNQGFATSLMRRSIWEKAKYSEGRKLQYEDWKFYIRLWLNGAKFKYIDKLIYEHTQRPNSMLRIMDKDRKDYVKIATEELDKSKPIWQDENCIISEKEKERNKYWEEQYTIREKEHRAQNELISKDFLKVAFSNTPFTNAFKTAKSIAEFGCGTGSLSLLLKQNFPHLEIIATDIINKAFPDSKLVTFKIFDIGKYPVKFEKHVDLAICSQVLEHFQNPWLIINNMLEITELVLCIVPDCQTKLDGYLCEGGAGHVFTFSEHGFRERYNVISGFKFISSGLQTQQLAVLLKKRG